MRADCSAGADHTPELGSLGAYWRRILDRIGEPEIA